VAESAEASCRRPPHLGLWVVEQLQQVAHRGRRASIGEEVPGLGPVLGPGAAGLLAGGLDRAPVVEQAGQRLAVPAGQVVDETSGLSLQAALLDRGESVDGPGVKGLLVESSVENGPDVLLGPGHLLLGPASRQQAQDDGGKEGASGDGCHRLAAGHVRASHLASTACTRASISRGLNGFAM